MNPHFFEAVAALIGGMPINPPSAPLNLTSLAASGLAVEPGALFVAVRGFSTDGHNFVEQAFERGALACVVEDPTVLKGRPGIQVTNSRAALSALAAAFNGDPSTRIKVVGVTGTNGKTTTNWIIYHVLNQIGGGALRIGTLGTELMNRERVDGALTSPDPLTIHALLGHGERKGVRSCVMEVSSHALDQARVDDVCFDVVIFMNLSRDHLDYHGTFEAYFTAKRKLFELIARGKKATKVAVINADDPYGMKLIAELPALGLRDLSFGSSELASVRIEKITERAGEMSIVLRLRGDDSPYTIETPFVGLHNAENVTAAFAACLGLGYEASEIISSLRSVPQVPGRLERIDSSSPRVFVDYAHTPDALDRAIKAVRVSTVGELWVIFGCGGDRDRGKRPQMAKIAALGADHVVVTSDNPRSEDPQAILADILSEGTKPSMIELDRAIAITTTVQRAAPNDTILIAGKGHEDYQIIGKERFRFSDQDVASQALKRRT